MDNNYIKESTLVNIISGNIDNIEENDLVSLKSRIKEVEKKIKEKNKPKTITISGDVHSKVKKYCTTFNLNIGEWTEKIILNELSENNCIILDDREEKEVRKDLEKEITDKWFYEKNRNKYLIKANVLLSSKSLRFWGYSIIDGKPIYEFIGEDMSHFKISNDFDSMGIIFTLVREAEISKGILFNEEINDVKFID
jgi:hypothetical protein